MGSDQLNSQKVDIKLLAPCGLYCGVCPQYLKHPQKCGGCNSGNGFAKWERKLCGIIKCTKNQGIARCSECNARSRCQRLTQFAEWDSFVSHAPVLENLDELQQKGSEIFCMHLEQRILNKEYPPTVRKGTMNWKRLRQMSKGPYRPPTNTPEKT